MTGLPSGTVTMLFSDIEGSTRLLNRLGSQYVDALDSQRRIMRRAWVAHDGTEMGTEGDSFFVVFATAEAGVRAAVQAQRDLAGQAWPQSEPVRVRIGIHTGSPMVHDGGYVGMDVHRAARIAGAAHGGQVIISEQTGALVHQALEATVELVDLGSHQLKDLPAPEHLYQVTAQDLPADFPPIRSLGARSSLPRPPGRLVGREHDLARLTDMLTGSETGAIGLVTLTGPGGSGKTRLAIALADRLSRRTTRGLDGAYFVQLAQVTSTDGMWAAIAEVLDVPSSARAPEKLIEHLADRALVLVLDNLEQLSGAAAVVAELRAGIPQALLIATSRWPLHLAAEHEYAVSPLQVSGSGGLAEVRDSPAGVMFTDAARRVHQDFAITEDNVADVAEICHRLDGLPLALELAAARTKVLGPHAILARLDHALDLSSHDREVPPRQTTLRDTIAWSYRLLTSEQQALFRRLGVFSGGADLVALQAVVPDLKRDVLDVVSELIDASLVRVTEAATGEPRFWLLETIRSYALEALQTNGELARTREAHARHFARVAEDLAPLMLGPKYLDAYNGFSIEHDNMRAALGWAVEAGRADNAVEPHALVGMQIVKAMSRFSRTSGRLAEEVGWIEKLLAAAGDLDHPLAARCLSMLTTHYLMSDPDLGRELARRSLAMSRRLGDLAELAEATVALSQLESEQEDVDEAERLLDGIAGIVADLHDPRIAQRVTLERVDLAVIRNDFERALELLEETYAHTSSEGNPLDQLSSGHERAWILRRMGRPEEALLRMRTATDIAVKLSFAWRNGLTFMGEDYAGILADLGDAPGAARLLGAVDARREVLAFPRPASADRDLAESLGKARAALSVADWERYYAIGRAMPLEEALVTAESWHTEPEVMGGEAPAAVPLGRDR